MVFLPVILRIDQSADLNRVDDRPNVLGTLETVFDDDHEYVRLNHKNVSIGRAASNEYH